MMICVFGGLAAIPMIQQKAFPDLDINIIQIAVPYLGAAPEEVEEGVCVRIEEEIHAIQGVDRLTSSAAEGACGVSAEAVPQNLPQWASARSFSLPASADLERFFEGGCNVVERSQQTAEFSCDVAREDRLIYAGSFNPFHDGHRELVAAAQSLCGRPATLEVSTANVDKPTLGYVEIARRVDALPRQWPVLVTAVATFPEKARLFPEAVFAIGYDGFQYNLAPQVRDGLGLDRREAELDVSLTWCRLREIEESMENALVQEHDS